MSAEESEIFVISFIFYESAKCDGSAAQCICWLYVLQRLFQSIFYALHSQTSLHIVYLYVRDWLRYVGATLHWVEMECPKLPKCPFSPYKFFWCSVLATISSWGAHELH